jgi:predicted nucleic acid-binding protein
VKIYFDTSALVTALVDQLPNHEAALSCLAAACRDHEAMASTHALAEVYATLTALPLPRRIQAGEARTLIEGLRQKLVIVALSARLYDRAITRVAAQGMSSGVIYDALHLEAAEHADCRRLHTYNLGDFQRLDPQNIVLLAP